MPRANLLGQTFGKLLVVAKTKYKNKVGWLCRCSCTGETIVPTSSLKRGATKSCGCGEIEARHTNHRTHGHAGNIKSATHNSWRAMMARCYDQKSEKFPIYGGRGITVCDRWKVFVNFLADMGERPKGLTLHRRDNDKGYSKENCEWVTRCTQANNTRKNHFVTAFGKTQTIADWHRQTGIAAYRIQRRLARGEAPESVLA